MNTIQNREHHEALQASVNEAAARNRALLSDEELRKLEVLEKAVGDMEKAGLIFYLYSFQTVFGKDGQRLTQAMIQYNSIFKNVAAHDEVSGRITEEGAKKLITVNDSLLNAIYCDFAARNPNAPKGLTPEQLFYWFIGQVLWPALVRESQRIVAAEQKS